MKDEAPVKGKVVEKFKSPEAERAVMKPRKKDAEEGTGKDYWDGGVDHFNERV